MTGQQLRDAVLLVVGITAPVGLLVVNAAAFVMNHLADFRLSIGIAAVTSSLALSGLTAQLVLGRVAAFVPDLYARYHRWMIGAAVVSVAAWSLLGGWGAYQSMADARTLPNIYAVITAVWLVLLPIAMNLISGRLRRGRSAGLTPPAAEPPVPDGERDAAPAEVRQVGTGGARPASG